MFQRCGPCSPLSQLQSLLQGQWQAVNLSPGTSSISGCPFSSACPWGFNLLFLQKEVPRRILISWGSFLLIEIWRLGGCGTHVFSVYLVSDSRLVMSPSLCLNSPNSRYNMHVSEAKVNRLQIGVKVRQHQCQAAMLFPVTLGF